VGAKSCTRIRSTSSWRAVQTCIRLLLSRTGGVLGGSAGSLSLGGDHSNRARPFRPIDEFSRTRGKLAPAHLTVAQAISILESQGSGPRNSSEERPWDHRGRLMLCSPRRCVLRRLPHEHSPALGAGVFRLLDFVGQGSRLTSWAGTAFPLRTDSLPRPCCAPRPIRWSHH
jgi:hypothetical protein